MIAAHLCNEAPRDEKPVQPQPVVCFLCAHKLRVQCAARCVYVRCAVRLVPVCGWFSRSASSGALRRWYRCFAGYAGSPSVLSRAPVLVMERSLQLTNVDKYLFNFIDGYLEQQRNIDPLSQALPQICYTLFFVGGATM